MLSTLLILVASWIWWRRNFIRLWIALFAADTSMRDIFTVRLQQAVFHPFHVTTICRVILKSVECSQTWAGLAEPSAIRPKWTYTTHLPCPQGRVAHHSYTVTKHTSGMCNGPCLGSWPQRWLRAVIPASASAVTPKRRERTLQHFL